VVGPCRPWASPRSARLRFQAVLILRPESWSSLSEIPRYAGGVYAGTFAGMTCAWNVKMFGSAGSTAALTQWF
jgi:hypothetical protein